MLIIIIIFAYKKLRKKKTDTIISNDKNFETQTVSEIKEEVVTAPTIPITPTKNFEKEFWELFLGEKNLKNLLIHFVTTFSKTMDQNMSLFVEKIIGEELFEGKRDFKKLSVFIENELSKLDIKKIIPKNNIGQGKQEHFTIYDVDRLTGTQFEEFVVQLLNANGYSDSYVTGKAGDQGGDVKTTYGDETIIIQAKNYSIDKKVRNNAVQQVHASIPWYDADRGIVITNTYFSASAKEIASVLNITLWDRTIVIHMLNIYNDSQIDKSNSEEL